MDVKEAQKDMRLAYLGGSPGALVSGLAWLIAGILAIYTSKEISILVFFLGGMLIHPVGIILSKIFKRTGKHKADNPLAKLAIECTLILFIGLFIAYVVFQIRAEWFFSVMLMIIGSRYVLFQTIYGMKIYWIFGLILSASGIIFLISNQPFYLAAIVGGIIEIVFAILLFKSENSHENLLKS